MKLKKIHIKEEWNEGHPNEGGDGYWVVLKTGWCSCMGGEGSHLIHEDTKREVYKEDVEKCNCQDCIDILNGKT